MKSKPKITKPKVGDTVYFYSVYSKTMWTDVIAEIKTINKCKVANFKNSPKKEFEFYNVDLDFFSVKFCHTSFIWFESEEIQEIDRGVFSKDISLIQKFAKKNVEKDLVLSKKRMEAAKKTYLEETDKYARMESFLSELNTL